jgi:hypothetical protein
MPDVGRGEHESDGKSSASPAIAGELTGTPGRIQLAATDDESNFESEHHAAIIEAFLDTLVRVALSIASRQKDRSEKAD